MTEPSQVFIDAGSLLAKRDAVLGEIAPVTVESADDVARLVAAEREQARVDAWLRICPAVYRTLNFADLEHDEFLAAKLRVWLRDARNHEAGNMIVTGPTGVGKSQVGASLLRELHFSGLTVAFTLLDTELKALRPEGMPPTHSAMVAEVAVLDDVGRVAPTDYSRNETLALVDERWAHNLPTIVTTNLELEDLSTHMGERAYDRLRADAIALRIGGASRRRPRADHGAQLTLVEGVEA